MSLKVNLRAQEKIWKHISCSVSIKKEHNNGETITYKIKFIDTCKFMPSKLSNLVDKDCKHAQKEKILNKNANLLGLKTVD